MERNYRNFRGPIYPKPYDFISIPNAIRRQKTPGHLMLKPELNTGSLLFNLRTKTPLFINSGQVALSEDVGMRAGGIIQAHYKIGDKLAIPASSLKGAVRSVAEAVSASCLSGKRTSPRELSGDFRRSCTNTSACPACILFGTGGKDGCMGLVHHNISFATLYSACSALTLHRFL